MSQLQPESGPKCEATVGRSDAEETAIQPASSEPPPPSWVMSQPLRITVICFAGWGALVLAYQLISSLGEVATWLLIAALCIALAFTHRLWQPSFDRWFTTVWPKRSPEPKPEKVDWKTIIGGCIVLIIFRPILYPNLPSQHPRSVPSQGLYSETPGMRSGHDQGKAQRREATQLYWQTAVANLHVLRFTTPTGEQSGAEYLKEYFEELDARIHMAKAASTHHVETDLVQMAKRHLALDEQCLQLKPQHERLSGPLKRPADSTLDEANSDWLLARTMLQLDPELLNKIPAGLERELVKKVLEIEKQREGQLREIEIMQAVLRERLPGTPFSLPSLEP